MRWQFPDHAGLTVRRILAESAALLAIALVLAAAAWAIRRPLPLRADQKTYELELSAPLILPAEAVACYQAGSHFFVDAREGDLDATPHIPGAFAIRLTSFDEDLAAAMEFFYPEDALILYSDGDLQTLAALAERFRERGYTKLSLMAAELSAWKAAGGELSGGQ